MSSADGSIERWFEDYPAGAVFDIGSIEVHEQEVLEFARRFDPQPFHTDPVAAADSHFGGIIASGWHTASMMMRLLATNFLSPASSLGVTCSARKRRARSTSWSSSALASFIVGNRVIAGWLRCGHL